MTADRAVLAVGMQGRQRHHDAGRAKTALGTVLLHHALLDRMTWFLLEGFDGNQFLAMKASQQGDATVDCVVMSVAILVSCSCNDRAGTTVSGGAAFFGTGKAHFGAQPFQDAQIWVELVNFFNLAVQKKFDHGSLR